MGNVSMYHNEAKNVTGLNLDKNVTGLNLDKNAEILPDPQPQQPPFFSDILLSSWLFCPSWGNARWTPVGPVW